MVLGLAMPVSCHGKVKVNEWFQLCFGRRRGIQVLSFKEETLSAQIFGVGVNPGAPKPSCQSGRLFFRLLLLYAFDEMRFLFAGASVCGCCLKRVM
jgi:hypothetical protein